ncbi:MAG: phosphoribosylglycinamide formyltransferase [Solirubrobacterales bacterium]
MNNLRSAPTVLRIGVLASGEGSNLQAILDSVHGRFGVEVVCVASDKPHARALQRAGDAGVASEVFALADFASRELRDAAIAGHLRALSVDLVVLAGYMQILSPGFIAAFHGRIINVHPSLLPKYPGLRAIEQALKAGESQTGVTVHYVDEGVDTGPVIAQEAIGIAPGESLESLSRRIHQTEHRLLPEVIAQIANDAANG